MYVGILVYDVDASEAAEAGGLFDWDPAMLATARGWAPLLDIDALGAAPAEPDAADAEPGDWRFGLAPQRVEADRRRVDAVDHDAQSPQPSTPVWQHNSSSRAAF